MRNVILICLTVLFSGCSALFKEPSSTSITSRAHDPTREKTNAERYSQLKNSAAVDSRAKHYEQQGLSSENARAAAEIEFAKSGH